MDKVIIITGASSGFGLAMTKRFAKEGASLVLVARNERALDQAAATAKSLGAKAIAIPGDVTREDTFSRAIEKTMASFGRIDVLVNNAGGGVKIANLEEISEEEARDCLDLNLLSVINGCRAAIPIMKNQGFGLILNVTSSCTKFGWPGWSVYSAAKAGVSMLSRCLHAELRAHGIVVSVLAPGGSNTGFQASAGIKAFGWNEENALRPEHIAEAAYGIVSLPKGAVVPEMVVYGMEQEFPYF